MLMLLTMTKKKKIMKKINQRMKTKKSKLESQANKVI